MVPNTRLVFSVRFFRSSLVEMFAATASATCLPALSWIALATASQTCCLRDEITTLAPCSAIRSAMARPMPREEPVMTATFPVMSNKVMRFSQIEVCDFDFELSSVHRVRQQYFKQAWLQASLASGTTSGPAG